MKIKNARKKPPYCKYLPYVKKVISRKLQTVTDTARHVSRRMGKKIRLSTTRHLYYYVFREISRCDDIVSDLASNSELINGVKEAVKQGKKASTEIKQDLRIDKRTICDPVHSLAKGAIVRHYDTVLGLLRGFCKVFYCGTSTCWMCIYF